MVARRNTDIVVPLLACDGTDLGVDDDDARTGNRLTGFRFGDRTRNSSTVLRTGGCRGKCQGHETTREEPTLHWWRSSVTESELQQFSSLESVESGPLTSFGRRADKNDEEH